MTESTATTMVNINIPISDELHKRVRLAAVMHDRTTKDEIVHLLQRKAERDRPQL